jgi:hypothetical protein
MTILPQCSEVSLPGTLQSNAKLPVTEMEIETVQLLVLSGVERQLAFDWRLYCNLP